MVAIEIEADIVDHRLDIRSELLPVSAHRAKVIVMIEEESPRAADADILALARQAQKSFPRQSAEKLAQELRALRDEWNRVP